MKQAIERFDWRAGFQGFSDALGVLLVRNCLLRQSDPDPDTDLLDLDARL